MTLWIYGKLSKSMEIRGFFEGYPKILESHKDAMQKKSEFRLGSAIFGISDVDFLRMVRIKRDIEK